MEYSKLLAEVGITAEHLPKTMGGNSSATGYFYGQCSIATSQDKSDPGASFSAGESGVGTPMNDAKSENHHFVLTIAAGAKERYTLIYGQKTAEVHYTLRVGGDVSGMDIGFAVTFQAEGSDSCEVIEEWARHGMGSDKQGVTTISLQFCKGY